MTTPPPNDPGQYPQQPYGQQPPPYYPPPKPKKKVWPWVLGGVILVVILMFGGCLALLGGAANEVDKALSSATFTTPNTPTTPGAAPNDATTSERAATSTLVYEVTSDSGTANNITYWAAGANQSQETGAALPWRSREFDADQVTIKGVTAQNGGGGTITCKVIVDGETIVENSSSGQYAVVTCQAGLGS